MKYPPNIKNANPKRKDIKVTCFLENKNNIEYLPT